MLGYGSQGAPPCGTKIANMLGDFWCSVILQYITIINHPFFRGNFGPFPNGKKGKWQDSSKENMCLLQVLMENFIHSQSGYFTCLIRMGRHLWSYFLWFLPPLYCRAFLLLCLSLLLCFFCFSAFLRIIHFKLFSNGWNLPRDEPHLWMSLLQFSIPNGDVLQNDGRLLLDEPDSISSNQMQSGYFTCFIKIHRSRAHHCMKIRWTLLVLIGVGFSYSSICWDALRNNMYAGKNIVTPCKT